VAVKLYYEEVPNLVKRSTTKLQECMEKAMEIIWKEHYSVFYKHLLICALVLGPNFLNEI
jgi:hypothetical protein